jgi:putative flippase GtrA
VKKIVSLYNKYKEIVNYLIFGFLTTVISLIVYYGLTFTVLDPNKSVSLQIANILSWVAGVIFAYVTNRKYVFNSKNDNIVKEIGSFVGARVVTLIMDMLIMFIGVTLLKFNDKVFKLISQVVVIISNYLFSKIFVFKKEKD